MAKESPRPRKFVTKEGMCLDGPGRAGRSARCSSTRSRAMKLHLTDAAKKWRNCCPSTDVGRLMLHQDPVGNQETTGMPSASWLEFKFSRCMCIFVNIQHEQVETTKSLNPSFTVERGSRFGDWIPLFSCLKLGGHL